MVSEMIQESSSFSREPSRRDDPRRSRVDGSFFPFSSLWQVTREEARREKARREKALRKDLLHKLFGVVGLILAEVLRHGNLIRRLFWFLGFLAMLWQRLLESLLSSRNVSEFPNKHRPPCTTMPWNIRPALVVLWGVCWMFSPWSPIDDIQLQPLSTDEQTLFSSGKVFPHSNVHFVQLTFSTQILTMN
jgi:hypothetical protein